MTTMAASDIESVLAKGKVKRDGDGNVVELDLSQKGLDIDVSVLEPVLTRHLRVLNLSNNGGMHGTCRFRVIPGLGLRRFRFDRRGGIPICICTCGIFLC